MPALNIAQLETGKEAAHHRQELIRHVVTLRPPHEQNRPVKAQFFGTLVREITQVVERQCESLERDAELLVRVCTVGGSYEVREQELADRQILAGRSLVS